MGEREGNRRLAVTGERRKREKCEDRGKRGETGNIGEKVGTGEKRNGTFEGNWRKRRNGRGK